MSVGLIVILAVLTALLVLPSGVVVTAVKLRGPLAVLTCWWLAARWGIVGTFDGPAGFPVTVAWTLGLAAGGVWVWVTVRIGRNAWAAGYRESRMWLAAKRNIEGF